ncbi:hypothetical protein VNO78_21316 [Psophocarpus tetragonolobus]|uniref:NB-ARC domain-containing protein n=1 Tax=Psophocarpus tetragonolobus TaxID=3891 RepID=A0AAN9SC21_PSOTE
MVTSFLLVLDDVWNEDHARWDEFKEIIDVGVGGSKILVTTRSHSIAAMMWTKSSYSYLLRGLSEEDSFSLFVKLAFKEGEEKKHPQLLEIAREIVKRCGGILLAVKTLGSSLISRFDKKMWESIRDNAIWDLPQKEKDILLALQLSYDQLPSHLKRCFATFAFFPEDSLLNFSRVGNMVVFKLYDLVRDLAVYVAKGEYQLIDSRKHAQHLSSQNNFLGKALLPIGLKTLTIQHNATNEAFLNTLVSRCKYLRFLELNNFEYESLPRLIGKLKHLRFLSLQDSEKLKRVPDSVYKLQNLQTLNLIGCSSLQELPKGIRKLISLCQLFLTTKQLDLPEKEIANLTSLKLLFLDVCDKLESVLEKMQLSRLKTLGFRKCETLRSLSFNLIKNVEPFMINDCLNLNLSMNLGNQIPNSRLNHLSLVGLPQLVTLPQWLQGCIYTLQVLYICYCKNLKELPEWLPTLIYLKTLQIRDCQELLSLPNNTHHLTNLEYLEINGCPELYKRYQRMIGQDWNKI